MDLSNCLSNTEAVSSAQPQISFERIEKKKLTTPKGTGVKWTMKSPADSGRTSREKHLKKACSNSTGEK